MTGQREHRDEFLRSALDELGVPTPPETFFDDLERRLQKAKVVATRRRHWLRVAAAGAAAAVLTLVIAFALSNRPGAGPNQLPQAYALAVVRPVRTASWHTPYTSWWFVGDRLYWLTSPPQARDPWSKLRAHFVDLRTGFRGEDADLTCLLRRIGFPESQWIMLPDGRVIVDRVVKRVPVAEHLADSSVTWWEQTRLFIAAPPYTDPEPIGPLSTWATRAGTGGGGAGRSHIAASTAAVTWIESGLSGSPRPWNRHDAVPHPGPRTGLWAYDLANGRLVRIRWELQHLSDGTQDGQGLPSLPRAYGSSIVWGVDVSGHNPPVSSSGEPVPDYTQRPVRLYAFDVQTGEKTSLPWDEVDARAGDVWVSHDPSHLRFFDQGTGSLWTYAAGSGMNNLSAVDAAGDIVAWVEWQVDSESLVVRCYDTATHSALTLARIVSPSELYDCSVKVVGDRVYWTLETRSQSARSNWGSLTVHGARVWTEGGQLREQPVQPPVTPSSTAPATSIATSAD